MKKIIALVLTIAVIIACFAGCGSDKRELFNGKYNKYVTLCDYKGIEIDTNSEDVLEYIQNNTAQALDNSPVKKTEGVVENGDTVNMDYAGSVDGVDFTGGTAQGASLEVGSGQFIPGFEDQLIGKTIGSEFDIKVTFPDGYGDTTDLATGTHSITLSNTEAVFRIKLNYVQTPATELTDEIAQNFGFANKEELEKDIYDTSIENYVGDLLVANCTVDAYPEEDGLKYFNVIRGYYEKMAEEKGQTFEAYLISNGTNEKEFKEQIYSNYIDSFMKNNIIFYAILDKEKLTVTEEDIAEQAQLMADSNGATLEEIYEIYGNLTPEALAVQSKVLDFIISNAALK